MYLIEVTICVRTLIIGEGVCKTPDIVVGVFLVHSYGTRVMQ